MIDITFLAALAAAAAREIVAGRNWRNLRVLAVLGVLIAGNIPFKTEVASIHLFYRIEQDPEGSAAIAVVLLLISFTVLLGIGALRWLVTRHERG